MEMIWEGEHRKIRWTATGKKKQSHAVAAREGRGAK
jgi:hypothetical protein